MAPRATRCSCGSSTGATRRAAPPPRSGRRRCSAAEAAGAYPHAIRPEPDDRALVQAAQAGDRSALDALLRRHHDRLHLICRRLAGNEADALDATQEALIAIVRGLGRFDGRSSFSTWSYRVATNACLDELRRRRRRPRPGLPVDGDGQVADPSPVPAARIEGLAQRLAVDEALAQLPLEFRAAVVLRDLCDLDYAEIAHVLDLPPGTVRSRIARGRAQLARLLGVDEDADGGGNPSGPPQRPTPRAAAAPPPAGPTP